MELSQFYKHAQNKAKVLLVAVIPDYITLRYVFKFIISFLFFHKWLILLSSLRLPYSLSGVFSYQPLTLLIRVGYPQTYILKLYRPLLCPAEIKGKSVTDHQQDT